MYYQRTWQGRVTACVLVLLSTAGMIIPIYWALTLIIGSLLSIGTLIAAGVGALAAVGFGLFWGFRVMPGIILIAEHVDRLVAERRE